MYNPVIVFEGIDGVGKTTQANKLKNKIIENGRNAIILHFPSEGIIGKNIVSLLKEDKFDNLNIKARALLTASDFFQEMEKYINFNGVIIFDRYIHSSFASNESEIITNEWIKLIHLDAPNPDLVFFLKCNPKIIFERKNIDFGAKNIKRQLKMNEAYERVFKKNEGFEIDASQDEEAVFQKIWKIFNEKIKL